ncbi:uncharacterized protein samd1b isoform X2 [Engraulis encrasicolus]|uniref:uncharacterized protein samd1b isoform X2 n=1 Tax=Engraulis encrasicolus TaxID=184585 RepID=UPI002FD611C3
MSEPKYREWILETIDSLRSRKARPDLERICRMVRRRHGSDPDRTRVELEKLIQEQTVLKVSYKGSISYRNAAKVQRKSRKKSELTPDRSSFSSGSSESLGSGELHANKHATFNNNGDSAHSFTDQEEFGEKEPDSESTIAAAVGPNLDPHATAQTQATLSVPVPATVTALEQEGIISGSSETPSLPQTSSGNICLSCGATDCTTVGGACVCGEGVKASAAKDKRLITTSTTPTSSLLQTQGNNCNSEKKAKKEEGSDVCDNVRDATAAAAATSSSEHYTASTSNSTERREETHSDTDKATKTCSSACTASSSGNAGGVSSNVGNNSLGDRNNKTQSTLKPKPQSQPRAAEQQRGGASDSEGGGDQDQASADLGDRLVESVRSLTERSTSSSATAPPPALGLKEILGYLSTQQQSSTGLTGNMGTYPPSEKLTRSRVKAVLDREVARGRLRRTHLGHFALPTVARDRGGTATGATVNVNKPSSARVLKSALQERQLLATKKKVERKREAVEPMEVDNTSNKMKRAGGGGGGGGGGREEEEGKETESKNTTTAKALSGERKPATEAGPAGVKGCAEPMGAKDLVPQPMGAQHSTAVNTTATATSTVPLNHSCNTEGPISDQVRSDVGQEDDEDERMDTYVHTQDPVMGSDGLTSSKSCCKMEVGVSSCLLTPTASPRDLSSHEERGMNGVGFVKLEGGGMSPADWTVTDVVDYFTSVGFPEQALAFKTQEIDGKSLLLMQRNDVLTGLSIRLGPALKIYERHVKVLQKTHFQDESTFC